MDVQLQELIDKIKKDGIANAESEAQKIIAEAEKKAQSIIADAEEAFALDFFLLRSKERIAGLNN